MRAAVAGAAAALLSSGCAFFSDMFDRPQPVIVTELQRLPECVAQDEGAQPKIHYFEAAALVSAWEQSHGIAPTPIDAVVEGPFALIELGEPAKAGYAVLVSREAILHTGKRLVLQSTFYAAQTGGAGAEKNPCVLLALPPRHYKAIELYDQEGALRAMTSAKEELPEQAEAPAPPEAPTQQETPKEEQNK